MFKTIFCRFSGIFNKKTTFREFEEFCEQIYKKKNNNDKKETIDSNIDLLTNFNKKHLISLLCKFRSSFLNNY